MDQQHRESEGKAKIEGYMSVSDEEAHHRILHLRTRDSTSAFNRNQRYQGILVIWEVGQVGVQLCGVPIEVVVDLPV